MKMKKECTHFSALMMHYISTRNVRIADLAAYCHYDRATLYQIIRGKRAPVDQAQVKQFVIYLKLNLAQQEELFGAYYECLYGPQAYRTIFG
ncbi:MAG: hypothetical protein PHI94_06860 [Eubacteriaceae bacterium]|nr:hypothetical protein [Eubacteriaceae bacterium]